MTQGWKWGIGVATAMVMLGLLLHWHNVSEKRNIRRLRQHGVQSDRAGPQNNHRILRRS